MLQTIKDTIKQDGQPMKKMFKSIKARSDAKRTAIEKVADWMTASFGSITFLVLNVIVFIVWILVNTGLVPGVKEFDPFPFSLLTTIVSLEAIILAIFVLISQNRSVKVDDLREETHFQLNIIAEKEITKVLTLVTLVLKKQGVDISQDPELKMWLKPTSEEDLEKSLEEEIF